MNRPERLNKPIKAKTKMFLRNAFKPEKIMLKILFLVFYPSFVRWYTELPTICKIKAERQHKH